MDRTLLVVDDAKVNREILKKIFSTEYDVLEAENGQEAMAIIEKSHGILSAVLLDLSMPVMDGFEVLVRMRQSDELRQIPVLVTTGQTEEMSEIKALKLGANDYISKPYNAAIIRQRIRNVINLKETSALVNELRQDRLTGLFSRNSFFEKAQSMLLKKPAGYYVIACYDIDKFKVINDQYGTEKGDEVLRFIGGVFQKGFSKIGGICSRMAADNFAILYPVKYHDSEHIKKIRRESSMLDGTISPVTFSIGRYIADDLSLSVSAMYDRAAMAEASVKGLYDVNIADFDESMRDNLLAEQKIVAQMKHALETEQFEPWFQPQYDNNSGKLIGAEALVRWRHPEKGLISPGVFIPIFEKNGFIYELDRFIWEKTCSYLRRWTDEKRNPLPVSVNISRVDVFRGNLAEVLTSMLEKYNLPVNLLLIEITESAFSTGSDQIVNLVKHLVDKGFTVEIDDFGSGYSSLNTLKDVPAQIIKLDMKFLESADGSERGGNIVESMVRMAKWLGMSVIAEGVETQNQADFLKSIGCCYVQGYLYAKPMPLEEYEALAKTKEKERELLVLETVENLNNNEFWNPDSIDTLIFNSYIGGACILEYCNGKIEVLRVNDKYLRVLGGKGMTIENALKLNWTNFLDKKSTLTINETIEKSFDTKSEASCEVVFYNLPGCENRIYIHTAIRVIASVGERKLVYCTIYNTTLLHLAEQKRLKTTEQLRFLEHIGHKLLTQPDPETGINAILRKLLNYFDACFINVFEFDFSDDKAESTYCLAHKNCSRKMKDFLNKPLKFFSYWLNAFSKDDVLRIDAVSTLADSRSEKEFLASDGISSLLAVPLRKDGKLCGMLCVIDPRKNSDQVERLLALCDYIVILLTRRDLNKKINSEKSEDKIK